MSGFTVEFEFEIGDLVFFKGAQHTQGQRPKQFIVYERIAQECHGGVQRLYMVSEFAKPIAETVLTKEEPAYLPMSDGAVVEHFSMLEQEREWRELHFNRRIERTTKEAKEEYRKNHPDTESD